MRFENRQDAGRQLAKELHWLRGQEGLLVLGIPRGGVVVAYEVAKALDAPLDVYITRKIGAPHNPELAIGAAASDGTVVLDHDLIQRLGVAESYVEQETARQSAEIKRRLAVYRDARPELDLTGRTVILVDDGVATGATALASVRAIKARRPSSVILAIPVAPPDTIRKLASEADQVVSLHSPDLFWAVGAFYAVFDQTRDAEVVRLLQGSS